MKKELPYFRIDGSYGGNQDWFAEPWMRLGGCAAETACDICVYLDTYYKTNLCPCDVGNLHKKDYVRFASQMKPYLHPRISGIDSLKIYTDGFGKYLKDKNSDITLEGVEGSTDYDEAKAALKAQIDLGLPVAYLNLNHKNRRYKDYIWHWFIINGYEETDGVFRVKAVNYSMWEWFDFDDLWHTGFSKKGGFVLIRINEKGN